MRLTWLMPPARRLQPPSSWPAKAIARPAPVDGPWNSHAPMPMGIDWGVPVPTISFFVLGCLHLLHAGGCGRNLRPPTAIGCGSAEIPGLPHRPSKQQWTDGHWAASNCAWSLLVDWAGPLHLHAPPEAQSIRSFVGHLPQAFARPCQDVVNFTSSVFKIQLVCLPAYQSSS